MQLSLIHILMFTDGNIVVRMLESVREHVLEGKAMHHCVGSGTNYSLNPDCIIFSARIAEQRVETCLLYTSIH